MGRTRNNKHGSSVVTHKNKNILPQINLSEDFNESNESRSRLNMFNGGDNNGGDILPNMENQLAIYTISEKVKYPGDDYLMKVCYDALSSASNEKLQTKIKHVGWKR